MFSESHKEQPGKDGQEQIEEDDAEFLRLLKEASAVTDPQQQDALTMALLARASEWAEQQEPTERDALEQEYHSAAEQMDWQAAEHACRRLLALSGAAEEEGTADDALADFSSYSFATRDGQRLAGTLSEQERHSEALAAAQSATQAARAADMLPLLIMALQTEAACARRAGEQSHALSCLVD